MREQAEAKVEEAKEREKISYRDHILELEAKITQIGLDLADANERASPQREAHLAEYALSLAKQKEEQAGEIFKFAEMIRKRDKDIADLKA